MTMIGIPGLVMGVGDVYVSRNDLFNYTFQNNSWVSEWGGGKSFQEWLEQISNSRSFLGVVMMGICVQGCTDLSLVLCLSTGPSLSPFFGPCRFGPRLGLGFRLGICRCLGLGLSTCLAQA